MKRMTRTARTRPTRNYRSSSSYSYSSVKPYSKSVNMKDFDEWNKNHKNFMTPRVIQVKQKGNKFYELSEGTDFDNRKIYGASEIEYNEGFKTKFQSTGRGKMFYSESEARQHLQNLQDN